MSRTYLDGNESVMNSACEEKSSRQQHPHRLPSLDRPVHRHAKGPALGLPQIYFPSQLHGHDATKKRWCGVAAHHLSWGERLGPVGEGEKRT